MPMANNPPLYFNRIRQLRLEKNLKQCELSHIMGFKCASQLSDLENGLKLPPLDTAMKLEVALQRLIDDIYPQLYNQARSAVARRREQFFREREHTLRKI